jgi:AraC family transcriptional regulator
MSARIIEAGLSASETHWMALSGAHKLLAHSEGKGWKNIYAASVATESPWAGTLPAVAHHCLVYCLNQTAKVQRSIRGDETRTVKFSPRQFAIMPGEIATHWDISGRPDVLLLYVNKSMMDRLTREALGDAAEHASIITRMAFTDTVLEQLALTVLEGLRAEAGSGRFYVDHMATAIAARLISHHMRLSPTDTEETDFETTNLNSRLRRVCSYIDASLGTNLTLSQLAAEANLSQDHLIRTFRQNLGMTPHQYVMQRRIEKAKELLISTNTPIAELSMATGFSDQSHLSTAFRRAVGQSPARYRKLGK